MVKNRGGWGGGGEASSLFPKPFKEKTLGSGLLTHIGAATLELLSKYPFPQASTFSLGVVDQNSQNTNNKQTKMIVLTKIRSPKSPTITSDNSKT